MENWKKTTCALCAQNCGLEVLIEDNEIKRVKGDKLNPQSEGYFCHKGASISYYQDHSDRLTQPLKKTENGFVPISWEQAIKEISEKLKATVDTHGPRSFSFVGGGGQGAHFEASFGMDLLKGMGSKYNYNSLAQELTGYFWVCGRMIGRQNRFVIPDEKHSEMILAVGWNGMVSHQMPQAPKVLREFSKNPDKLLVVIDPRKSETAKVANTHVAVRPGTDALLAKAMISIILSKGWENKKYIENHTTGFDKIKNWFEDFQIKEALEFCEVDYDQILQVCKELSVRKWCIHTDLGILMNRHSTVTSYLYMLLATICGRMAVPGGNIVPGTMVPLGSHTDERKENTWKTVKTNIPAINGAFPPNVIPEEILNDHPDRLRAIIVSGANPMRSYADTKKYQEAFEKLDLLVTMEVAMSETAKASDYVLPLLSAYEAWDTTFFAWNFPNIYFNMRKPVIKNNSEAREAGKILTDIADGVGLVPKIPKYLYWAAKRSRKIYAAALMFFITTNMKHSRSVTFVLAKTLGKELGSTHLAALWGLLLTQKKKFWSRVSRLDSTFSSNPIFRADQMFDKIMNHPQGLWVGAMDENDNFKEVTHPDNKIDCYIPELEETVIALSANSERKDINKHAEYPLVLMAGQHKKTNANTLLRNPKWLRNKRGCTLSIHPEDAIKYQVVDGEMVQITTAGGSGEIEVEVSDDMRIGQVGIPHGYGLEYEGKTIGLNANQLTSGDHRDPLAGTPYHRYVPCRISSLN